MFTGSITALVTPFRDGRIDEKALQALVEWQIAEGSSGLVPCGTTGESPTLSHEEHHRVVELVIEAAADRVPVIAGTGSNSTEEAVELSQHAEKAGADALLVVSPYYNRPSQEGLYQHFRHIDARVGIPIIVYNIPPRSAVDIAVETLARIYQDCSNVVGVKDATANLNRPSLERMACGPDFNLLSGEDGTALGYMAHGGHGCISVTSNIAPRLCAQMQDLSLSGDFAGARAINDKLSFLHKDLFMEPNPSPAKYVANRLNLCANEMRLPLVPVSKGTEEAMDFAMRHAGLI